MVWKAGPSRRRDQYRSSDLAVAAPIRRGPETIAALNVSSAVSRVSLDDLRRRILPPLVEIANTISNALTQQGPAHHRTVG